jgi:hypothetical protein
MTQLSSSPYLSGKPGLNTHSLRYVHDPDTAKYHWPVGEVGTGVGFFVGTGVGAVVGNVVGPGVVGCGVGTIVGALVGGGAGVGADVNWTEVQVELHTG